MFCKKCGAEIKNGAQFCPKCGIKVKEEAFSQGVPKESSFHTNQFLQKFDIKQLLQKSGVNRILKSVTKRQMIGVSAAVLAIVFAILLISASERVLRGKIRHIWRGKMAVRQAGRNPSLLIQNKKVWNRKVRNRMCGSFRLASSCP